MSLLLALKKSREVALEEARLALAEVIARVDIAEQQRMHAEGALAHAQAAHQQYLAAQTALSGGLVREFQEAGRFTLVLREEVELRRSDVAAATEALAGLQRDLAAAQAHAAEAQVALDVVCRELTRRDDEARRVSDNRQEEDALDLVSSRWRPKS